jgi:c-di-GMP-binding flagellar brake protein YcgR
MTLPAEIIKGEELKRMLGEWIRSKRVCKLEIPETEYGWFTLLLRMAKGKKSDFLGIDHITGFEKALSRGKSQEVQVEFLEKDGVRCFFSTRILRCLPEEIQAALPATIQRLQRRSSFRIESLLGTEVHFHIGPNRKERGGVKDYSLGGLSFFLEGDLLLDVGQHITDIQLYLPGSKESKTVCVHLAVIRRVEMDRKDRKVCAMEFLELPEKARNELWSHIVETQRRIIAKTNKP